MINYRKGDATDIEWCPGKKIVAHVCNDIGLFSAGFALAISKKWPFVKEQYLFLGVIGYQLGQVQIVQVTDDIGVANMVAQRSVRGRYNPHPLDYYHLAECLRTLAKSADGMQATVHMPRIGCGLAGGTWDKVEPIIQRQMADIQTYVYDLE